MSNQPANQPKPRRRVTELFMSNVFILMFAGMLLVTHTLLVQTGDPGLGVVGGDGLWFLIAGGIIGANSQQPGRQDPERPPGGPVQ